ncbi:hypothetical protein BDZ94DRAFT_1248831 [Collybia nuda]|uniref:BHLH domain-containing protein n=1 Tax=Collybia nuda TaxID=64659 RepID=A0A9P5YCY9_9AGAR|nr:hypothetical protein BDZ94DRAFT_1248831 [Collybia nuda]
MGSLAEKPLGLQEPSLTNEEDKTAQISPPTITDIHLHSDPAMPDKSNYAYTASCNPPRRAKQSRLNSPSRNKSDTTSLNPLPILPKPLQEDSISDSATGVIKPAPARRGRKPGPLSRTAREAQRKLNHSIIEKARRTKINEALATLRQLVPDDYGSSKDIREAESDDDEQTGEVKRGKKPKGTGKREEKEKEFKLEILIRTVSFMQDLLVRVGTLEAESRACSKCGSMETSTKRKRSQDSIAEEVNRISKRVDYGGASRSVRPHDRAVLASMAPPSPQSDKLESRPYLGARLPSISSWLPDSQIDPVLLSVNQLPSPPSSVRVDPVDASHIPPTLNLGPIAKSSLLSPLRTPEDESAASLLLQISASSPPLVPVSGPGPTASFDLSTLRTACVTPIRFKTSDAIHAQTPGTMLGLMRLGKV